MNHGEKNPLDYQSQPNSAFDPDVNKLWWVRLARRKRRRVGVLRIAHFVIMLTAIAVLLWYIRGTLGVYTNTTP
jgi:hypothetical protein